MKKVQYTFWQDGKFFIGFLNDYNDYETQRHKEINENLANSIIEKLSDE